MTASPIAGVPNETIVRTYDRLAVLYDWFLTPLKVKTRQRAVDVLGIEGGETVVEIGCGPGHALLALSERVGQSGYVVGLDAAPGMVRRARQRLVRGTSGRTDALLGDARSVPFRTDTVDFVFIEDTLELFSNDEMATVVDEVHRILRDDGRLCVLTMERAGAEGDRFVKTYDWLFENVPGYRRFGCRPIYARRALETGGFEIVRRERHRRGHVWPVELLVARPDQ